MYQNTLHPLETAKNSLKIDLYANVKILLKHPSCVSILLKYKINTYLRPIINHKHKTQ